VQPFETLGTVNIHSDAASSLKNGFLRNSTVKVSEIVSVDEKNHFVLMIYQNPAVHCVDRILSSGILKQTVHCSCDCVRPCCT